jgi:hypothetical protein
MSLVPPIAGTRSRSALRPASGYKFSGDETMKIEVEGG